MTTKLKPKRGSFNHECTRACLRMRVMFGVEFFWCARYSWNGRHVVEHKNWRTKDREFALE